MKVKVTIPSESGGKDREVTVEENGHVWCNCPGWMFQRKPVEARSCKHTQMVRAA